MSRNDPFGTKRLVQERQAITVGTLAVTTLPLVNMVLQPFGFSRKVAVTQIVVASLALRGLAAWNKSLVARCEAHPLSYLVKVKEAFGDQSTWGATAPRPYADEESGI